MSTSGKVRRHIRSNAIGYLALFVALTIAPAWAGTLDKKSDQRSGTSAKAKAKRGPRGPAGPAGSQGLQGPQGIPGPISGQAGGELTGNYPNPNIGNVAGLDLVPSTATTGGINFGSSEHLYRFASGALRTDAQLNIQGGSAIDNFLTAAQFTSTGNTQLGDGATDQTLVVGFLQIPSGPAVPPAGDCDNVAETGRIFYDHSGDVLYLCDGTAWQPH